MIIAFEGPSGAGKDYKKEVLLKARGSQLVHTITRQKMGRVVDIAAGAYMSSADDYAALAAATMDGTRDVIIDRFMLSRPVYWAIQFNSGFLEADWYYRVRSSLDNMRRMAVDEAYNRVPEGVIFLQPDIEIIIILPTIGQLEYQRTLSGKNYPFDATQELALYSQIAVTLLDRPLRGVTVTLTQ